MDYVASMEPPSSSAGALKSTSSHNPRLRGQVTLFMSSNGETSQRHPPLWAARHQTMHQNIKSIHPHCTPIFYDERCLNVSDQCTPAFPIYIFHSPITNDGDTSTSTTKQQNSLLVSDISLTVHILEYYKYLCIFRLSSAARKQQRWTNRIEHNMLH